MKGARRKNLLAFVGLIALGFGLSRYQTVERRNGRTDPISAVVHQAVQPGARALRAVVDSLGDVGGAFARGRRLEEENERLRAIAAAAETYMADVDRLRAEIDHLRRLGGWKPGPGRDAVPADVVGYFPHEHRITIDAGAGRGVKRGMPVVTFDGLVGRVETVDRTSAQVLLISAPAGVSRLSALVLRAPPNPPPAGLIRGEGPNSLMLELTDPTATVESGNLVVTSGFSSLIPRGIPIGRIVSVHDDPAFGRRYAYVFPRVAIGTVREVMVVK